MDHPASSSPSLTTNVQLRIGLLFVLLVSSAVSTALPVLLSLKFSKSVKKDPLWRKLLLSCLNCFAGGVFLGVTFLHLLPHLSSDWGIILSDVWPSEYPFNDFLVVLGFFLILVIEQIAHTWQYGNKKETVVETSKKTRSEQQVAIKRYRSQPNILASLQGLSAEEHVLSLKYHSDCNACEREHKKHKGSTSSLTEGPLVYVKRTGELPNDPRLHEPSPSNANHQQNTEEVNDITALLNSAEHQYGSPFTSPDQKNSENKPVNTPSGSQSSLRALFLAVALSVHSIFEGLAFGLIESDAEVSPVCLHHEETSLLKSCTPSGVIDGYVQGCTYNYNTNLVLVCVCVSVCECVCVHVPVCVCLIFRIDYMINT